MCDELHPYVADELLCYLTALYGDCWAADAPVWVSVSNHRRGGALSVSAIADIYMARLGTSQVHRLRHTFARMMEVDGAPISKMQQRLGHASAATTAIYLQRLRSDENPHAEGLVQELGIS